jgi:hypothetical protein
MRLFRRQRPEPAAKPAAAPVVAPEPDTPARAVQVVTGPPPLRTPEPASASPPPAPAATVPEPPAAPVAAAARPAESPKPMRHWHLAPAEMRVPASLATPRRTAPREHHSRWHQV